MFKNENERNMIKKRIKMPERHCEHHTNTEKQQREHRGKTCISSNSSSNHSFVLHHALVAFKGEAHESPSFPSFHDEDQRKCALRDKQSNETGFIPLARLVRSQKRK